MHSLLRLKPYLRPYLWLIVAGGLLALPLAALRTAPAPLLKYLIDDLLPSRDAAKVITFVIFFVGLYLINFAVRFLHYYANRIVVARANQRIKNDLYNHLVGLSADYFTQQSTGTLISRVANDTVHIDGGISSLNAAIREPIHFLILLGYAFHLNWRLTLVTFVILPLLALVFSVTGRNLKRYIQRMAEESARIFSTLQESFTGIRIIKTFGLEKVMQKRFFNQSENYTRFLLKTAILEETSHPMVDLLTSVALAAIIYVGSTQVIAGRMTSGDLIAFFGTFALMMNPLRLMNDLSIKLHTASAACSRVFEVFDWKPRLHEAARPKPLRAIEKEISFDGISFAYPDEPGRPVLKDVSFRLSKGKALALVGESGAGKSSLVSLIPRIFDVTGGAIRIDGTDIREYSIDDLRSLIAVVSQDVFLFNDTIEENIRMGKPSATREEIRDAARKAHALDFIEKLPQGLATVIGDRGQKLSGGERQRLSIARAFLRNAPILLLDEATSALDSASERAVQSALEELMKSRTTLIIAHRLSTIRHADEILVVKEGRIVESGTHEQLLARDGEYSKFHRIYGTAEAKA